LKTEDNVLLVYLQHLFISSILMLLQYIIALRAVYTRNFT